MSTISKERLEQLASGNAWVCVQDDEATELARIALASLEAVPVGRNPVLAYADSYRDMAKQGVESIPVWSVITDLERNIAPLFTAPPAPMNKMSPAAPDKELTDDVLDEIIAGAKTSMEQYLALSLKAERAAPPAPVSVPAAMEMDDDFDSAFEHGKAVGWNAYRAAMLQGAAGNSPAIPEGYALVPVEPTHEMLEAGDEQFGTYDVYRRMIAAAPKLE